MVKVLVPTAGGINGPKKRVVPNMVKKISKKGDGVSYDANPLSGQVRSDPRVNPMDGDKKFMCFLMPYNIADQNHPCVDIQQMTVGMMGSRVCNPNKTLGTESMRARSLPANGNEPSAAWLNCDVKKFNEENAKKHLRSYSNWNMNLKPAFKAPDGVNMVS